MSPTTYFITGANRGIGFEFAKQLLEANPEARVIAGARAPEKADALQALVQASGGRAAVITLDLNDLEGIKAAAEETAGLAIAAQGIDVLINNAGIFGGALNSILAPDALATLQENLNINTVGTLAVSLAFLPLLRQGSGKAIWSISTVASQFVNGLSAIPHAATYGASKSAQNMVTLKLARALQPEGFTILALHPGLVDSDMGKALPAGMAELTPAQSAEQSLAVLRSKGPADNGTFWSYTGDSFTW